MRATLHTAGTYTVQREPANTVHLLKTLRCVPQKVRSDIDALPFQYFPLFLWSNLKVTYVHSQYSLNFSIVEAQTSKYHNNLLNLLWNYPT